MNNDTNSPFEELPILQRASVFRRGCAGMMDFILTGMIAVICAFVLGIIFLLILSYLLEQKNPWDIIQNFIHTSLEDWLKGIFVFIFAPYHILLLYIDNNLGIEDTKSFYGFCAFCLLYIFCWLVLTISYSFINALFLSSPLQATPGKLIFRLKVSDEAGHRLTFKKAFKRSFYQMLTVASLGIGFISLFRNEKQQTWYDKKCKTRVTSK